MKLLLDTHVMVWWLNGAPRLGAAARRAITGAHTDIYFSAASWWELSIKKSLGRLDIDLTAFRAVMDRNAIQFLDVRFDHADAVVTLSPPPGDRFDRMLVAQAQVEGLRLLTRDKQLKAYGGAVLFV